MNNIVYEKIYMNEETAVTNKQTNYYSLWKYNPETNEELFLGSIKDGAFEKAPDVYWQTSYRCGCEIEITEEELFVELV